MTMHPGLALPAIILALLLGTAPPSQAQPKPKGGEATRDFAQLMPADLMLYAEMDHPHITKQLLALIKGSALSDYGAFRDDLYKKNKLEAGDVGYFNFKASTWWAFVLAPEFLEEIGRMKGHALAITDVGDSKHYPEPKFLWVIDPGTSKILPLIARDVLTLTASMKSVRTVEGVRLYQSHRREFQYDDKGMKKEPKEGKIVPEGPVLATMPGLIVVGSEPDAVADVVLRARGKKGMAPALSELGDFKRLDHLRDTKQLFGYANLKKLYSKTGAFMHPGGLGTLFGFEASLFQLESLLGPESHKQLGAAFWLENDNPHLDVDIRVNPEKTGPLAKLLSSRTIDPGVLHFAPASAYGTLTVPLFKDPGDWPKLVTALQTAARKYSISNPKEDGVPTHVSISPDGKHAVTAANVFKLWDTAEGKESDEELNLPTFNAQGQLSSVALSPDGKRFVAAYHQALVRPQLIDTAKTQSMSLGIGNKDAPGVACVAFSPDGKRIVTGEGGWVKEWSADTGAELRSKKQHELENRFAQVTCVCFGAAGAIISGSNDKLVKVLLADGKVLTLKGHEQGITAVSASADGKRIVSGDANGVVKGWDAAKGTELFSFKGDKAKRAVRCVGISADGLRIASSGEDFSTGDTSPIKVWDLNKDQAKEAFALKGHRAAVISLVIATDGKSLVSGDAQGNVKVWRADDGTEVSSMPLSTLDIMARRFGGALANPVGREMIAGVHSATLVFAGKAPENPGPMVLLELKDAAAAKALVDMVPQLVSQGQKPQTTKVGKHSIQSLPEGKNFLEWPLSYGHEGNIVVFGATSAAVADALQGGVARSGFAAQADVAKTLTYIKDANGLLLWSGRNILNGLLKADAAELQGAIKAGFGKPGKTSAFERALLALYPQQLKKFGAELPKLTAELPAGFLTVGVLADNLRIVGSQHGLKEVLPRLLDAYVEWDLLRPSFSNFGPGDNIDEAKDEKPAPQEEKK